MANLSALRDKQLVLINITEPHAAGWSDMYVSAQEYCYSYRYLGVEYDLFHVITRRYEDDYVDGVGEVTSCLAKGSS